MIIHNWLVQEAEKHDRCIVALPGRGVTAELMRDLFEAMELENTLFIGLQPYQLSWYPQPNGANDQDAALNGIKLALQDIKTALSKIKAAWKIPSNKTTILGYSAGAVMALQAGLRLRTDFEYIISLAGAILDPKRIPSPNTSTTKTKFLLQANYDDDCFSAFERYLPMKHGLLKRGYNVQVNENVFGGHNSFTQRVANIAAKFIQGEDVNQNLEHLI